MKIALDAMGGDFAPKATVEGAVLAAREFGIGVVLVGDRTAIEKELALHNPRGLDLRIEHAPDVVTMDDSPVESIVTKPHSSIHVGFDLLKAGDVDGVVSAGNSGAVWMGASVILGNLPGVDRPAIATVLPAEKGFALLIDAGANTEVKPFNLVQFALMGSVYWHYVRGISRPRVGILSNGEEESKGTDLTRSAAATLHHMSANLNYIGYVEGRDINNGTVDVVVTDGFTGNVVIKTMEGFAKFLLGNVREVFAGTTRGKIAYFLVRKKFGAMRQLLDPSEIGGAPLLGINGVVIISHGSSNPQAIKNAIRAAANEAFNRHVNREIVEGLAHIPMEIPAKPAGKGIRAIFSRMRERLHRKPRDAEPGKHPEIAAHTEAPGQHDAPPSAIVEVAPPFSIEAAAIPATTNGTAPSAHDASKTQEEAASDDSERESAPTDPKQNH